MKTSIALLICILLMLPLLAQDALPLMREANQHYREGRYAEAVVLYRKALLVDNRDDIRFNLGNALYRSGELNSALQIFTALAEETGDLSIRSLAYYNQGVINAGAKNLDAAIEAFKNALRNDPSDTKARENLQKALAEKKKSASAPKQQPSTMNRQQAERKIELLLEKERQLRERMKRVRQGGSRSKDW